MWILFNVFLSISIYFLLLFITPKATNLHEILHIPVFWFKHFLVTKDNINTKKIRFGKLRNQYFLFHQPKKNPSNKDHIILYFHGGGWMGGSPEILNANAQLLADKGYISVFSNYRKAPLYSSPHMREDLTLCLQKLKAVQKELNIQNKKIILGGMSAGATLAALLAFQKEELDKISFDHNQIAGLFLCGPPIDLEVMKWSIPLYLFAGSKGSEKFKLANPVSHGIPRPDFPLLLIHGNKDGLVPYRNTVSFLEKTKTSNNTFTKFHTMSNGTHMEAASWSYENNEIRKVILDWLEEREN